MLYWGHYWPCPLQALEHTSSLLEEMEKESDKQFPRIKQPSWLRVFSRTDENFMLLSIDLVKWLVQTGEDNLPLIETGSRCLALTRFFFDL